MGSHRKCDLACITRRTGRLQSRKSRLDDRHAQLWPEQRQGYRRRSPLPPFRHPEASVKVIGILPRRNQEQWVSNINFDIKEMVETEGYEFANPGTALLLQDGKIDESLFIGDGLHPNNRGYELIAGEIASSNKSF